MDKIVIKEALSPGLLRKTDFSQFPVTAFAENDNYTKYF